MTKSKDLKYDKGKPIAGALVDFQHTLLHLSNADFSAMSSESANLKAFEACWLSNDAPALLAFYAIQLMPFEPRLERHTFIGQYAEHLMDIASLMEYGAEKKYKRSSWLEVPDGFNRYSDAMLRHYLESFGELRDKESGHYHLTCVAWNAMCRCELYMRNF